MSGRLYLKYRVRQAMKDSRRAIPLLILLAMLVGVGATVLSFVGGQGWIERYLASKEKDKRLQAIAAAELIGGETAADLLAPYATDVDTDIAMRVLDVLGRVRTQRHRKRLTDAMTSDDPRMRAAGVNAASWYGPESPEMKVIADRLGVDAHAEVRCAAAKALGRQHAWWAMPELIAAMRSDDGRLRAHAAEAVFVMTGTRFPFRPNDEPDKREAVVKRIETLYKEGQADAAHKTYLAQKEMNKR